MKIVTTPREAHEDTDKARRAGARVGLVPTMGALHEGHASLVRAARARCGYIVASLFVNSKQFGPGEDLARYPRRIESDSRMLETLGCDLLFAPSEKDLYSPGDRTGIVVERLSDTLCGASRPGHFRGVALVVAKLFNIVRPDEAYFGQKDAQQAVIIQRMAADLDFPVRVLLAPTVRESDGLAMSSRNAYLDAGARIRSTAIYRSLSAAKERIDGGERDPGPLVAMMTAMMREALLEVDYAAIVDGATLEPLTSIKGTILIACAASIGGTRLIDNIVLSVSGRRVEETLLEFPEWSRYGT